MRIDAALQELLPENHNCVRIASTYCSAAASTGEGAAAGRAGPQTQNTIIFYCFCYYFAAAAEAEVTDLVCMIRRLGGTATCEEGKNGERGRGRARERASRSLCLEAARF